MLKQASLIILQVLEEFVEDYGPYLDSQDDNKLLEASLKCYTSLLSANVDKFLILRLFSSIREYVIRFQKPIFRFVKNYAFSGTLLYHLLKFTQKQSVTIKIAALSLIYLLFKTNMQEMKHFARMKLQSTLAIAKLVNSDCDYDDVQRGLDAIVRFSATETTVKGNSWHNQIKEVIGRHYRILDFCKQVSTQKEEGKDTEMVQELHYRISLEYSYSPDLRVTWLQNLASYHEKVTKEKPFPSFVLKSDLFC